MGTYDFAGTAVEKSASEAISDISMNRTMFVQKLTANAPVKPQAVYDLKTVDEVFAHFKPNVEVEFEDEHGAGKEEVLHFTNVGDFGANKITEQSSFLQNLSVQGDQFGKMMQQLKSNKLLNKVLENQTSKEQFILALQALAQELEDNK